MVRIVGPGRSAGELVRKKGPGRSAVQPPNHPGLDFAERGGA